MAGLFWLAVIVGPLQAATTPSVVLTWKPSPDPMVAGYYIYYGGASGVYTNKIYVGDVTNTTVNGLEYRDTYYFAATACSESGEESLFSNQSSYTVPARTVKRKGAIMESSFSIESNDTISGPTTLALNPVTTNRMLVSVDITTTNVVSGQWGLQSSPDLTNWTTIAFGTNSSVNVLTTIDAAPAQFFRLKSD